MKKLLPKFFREASRIEPEELTACATSFLLVLILMCAYYILRPVRDGLASDWSDAGLSFLWTLNFFISTAAVALYGFAVKSVRFKWLVPSVYTFFGLSFLLVYLSTFSNHHVLMDKAFYIWVSVFSLFNISVFWSFMADIYTKEESERLFPVIGAGASAGALIGPAIPTLFAEVLGTDALLLIAAAMVLIAPNLVLLLSRMRKKRSHSSPEHDRIGGNPFAGFSDFFTSRYMMSIGLFIVLYTAIASIIYFQQKNLLEEFTLIDRSRILGGVDWIVNILTFAIAFFATGRIVKRFGMPFTLAVVPLIMCFGFLLIAVSPVLIIVLVLQVVRRAGNYAVTRPAREMLFTEVSRESRFKTKPVIDIVAYRGGDMVTSWGFAAMTEGFGFGLGAVSYVGGAIAAIWSLIGIYLGRYFERISKR